MRVITFWIVVVSGFAVGSCAGESRKIDEVQYKNHRTASVSNETSQNHATLHKTYPVYPAQVYANLSNVRDFGGVNLNAEQQQPSRTTEMPTDVVRMFFTSATKRKPLQDTSTVTTPVTPSTYIVTARNVAVSADTKDSSHKSPVYSVPRSGAEVKYATSTVDFRGSPTVTEEQSRIKTKFNGTKIRRILKAQNQAAQSSLHSTATATAQMPPQFTNQRNSTAFAVNTKADSTVVASSKPFATVLVPKHVLDGGVQHQQQQMLRDHAQQEDSFRPIVPPIFTPYKSPNAAVDTNSIVDNRRSSSKNNQQLPHRVTSGTAVPKLSNYGFVKPVTYKVEEYVPGDVKPGVVHDRGNSNEQDRSDRTSMISQKRDVENPHKYDHLQSAPSFNENAPRHDGLPKRGEPLKYVLTEPMVGQFNGAKGPQQYREFYQATEWPAAAVKYEKYDAKAPQQLGSVRTQRPVSEPLPKEYFNGPPSNFSPQSQPASVSSLRSPQTESGAPEYVMGDLNPKEVLKSLLRDMIKSKQQDEINPKTPSTMDEIIDSYLNSNQQKADDSFDVQTDMNCNLKSTKYITDGQCVSTKPVVEAVCADRCLVSANSLSQRHRSSPLDNAQVEALQCYDGDVKMVRVQLKCRDGNMFNNVIKVVTNCRCKLHQRQPQMRSNSPTHSPPRATINPDIMAIAAGQF
ncbi:uncharacterized protein LOC111026992 isoform X2 [Myzus persicae]|uniref:uncharacterized protein LOC111026992 isoform X2 n=1 Tax=Myzus persicae TaxID=13164 RepID=UPI000B939624|nr:uncharacterized protein LOC111026992 isoform X2 [Myzus persicae]